MPYAPKTLRQRSGPATDDRPSAAKRGYGRRWRDRFRPWFLARHPLCEDCMGRGEVMQANEVHHLVKMRDDRTQQYDESNCVALCKACHSRRTAGGE